MPSTHDSNTAARNVPPTHAGREALIARARELIANPDYPTAAIVEELAELLARQVAVPPAGS